MKTKVNSNNTKIGFYISLVVNLFFLGVISVYLFTSYLDYTILAKIVPRLCEGKSNDIEFCNRLKSKNNSETAPRVQNYSDLSACGNFPAASSDSGPTTRYSVCRNSESGECYYRKGYYEQISGCDPEFEKNPYGKEECFMSKVALFSVEGKVLNNKENPKDTCAPTTQKYFESKVK